MENTLVRTILSKGSRGGLFGTATSPMVATIGRTIQRHYSRVRVGDTVSSLPISGWEYCRIVVAISTGATAIVQYNIVDEETVHFNFRRCAHDTTLTKGLFALFHHCITTIEAGSVQVVVVVATTHSEVGGNDHQWHDTFLGNIGHSLGVHEQQW